MTKTQLQRLIDECCQRFDSVRARFAQDDRREPNDSTTRLAKCWWEALADLELVDCLEVVREIFDGTVPRPYPSDFPGTIASEIRKRKAQRSDKQRGNFTQKAEQYRIEAQATREADSKLEADLGPVLDAMTPEEQRSFAVSILNPMMVARWERNPRGPLARLELLEALRIAQQGRILRTQEANR
jgi:hypothetical protein